MSDVMANENETKPKNNHIRARRHVHNFDHLNATDTNVLGDGLNSKNQYLSESKQTSYKDKPKFQSLTKIRASQIFSIKKLYIHKDYDGHFSNNIAVLELVYPVSLNHGVNVIGINDDPDEIHPDDELYAYGWDNVSI